MSWSGGTGLNRRRQVLVAEVKGESPISEAVFTRPKRKFGRVTDKGTEFGPTAGKVHRTARSFTVPSKEGRRGV